MTSTLRTTIAAGLTAALALGGVAAATTSATAATKRYTTAQVKKHSTAADCWTIIGKNVYNLTGWVNQHPGGIPAITQLCGKNGTKKFTGMHGGSAQQEMELAKYKIGALKKK